MHIQHCTRGLNSSPFAPKECYHHAVKPRQIYPKYCVKFVQESSAIPRHTRPNNLAEIACKYQSRVFRTVVFWPILSGIKTQVSKHSACWPRQLLIDIRWRVLIPNFLHLIILPSDHFGCFYNPLFSLTRYIGLCIHNCWSHGCLLCINAAHCQCVRNTFLLPAINECWPLCIIATSYEEVSPQEETFKVSGVTHAVCLWLKSLFRSKEPTRLMIPYMDKIAQQ